MKGKKHKITVQDDDLAEYEKCIEELADAVTEGLKDQHNDSLEPFDVYAEKLRTKVHANVDVFRGRFIKGYKILLNELKLQNPPSTNPKH